LETSNKRDSTSIHIISEWQEFVQSFTIITLPVIVAAVKSNIFLVIVLVKFLIFHTK